MSMEIRILTNPLYLSIVRVNPVLHDFVSGSCEEPIPPAPLETTSPFETALVNAGWTKEDSDDEYL